MTSWRARPAKRSCTLTSRTMITTLRRCTFVPTVGTWRCTRGTPLTRSPAGGCQSPGNGAGVEPERTLDHGSRATYSNLYPARDGRLYAFVRAAGLDPHVLVSDDEGVTWRAGGRLLIGPGSPYVRYAADHTRTDPPPDDRATPTLAPTSIYHGIIDERRLLRSDGTVVDADLSDDVAVRTERLTSVFAANRGTSMDRRPTDGWRRPAICRISVHGREAANDYWYSWFDDGVWHTHFLAHAGNALYERRALLHRPRGDRPR